MYIVLFSLRGPCLDLDISLDGGTEITYTQGLWRTSPNVPDNNDDDDDSAAKNPRQLNACKQTDVSNEVEGAEIGQCRGLVPLHRRKSFPFDLALQSRSSSVCLHPFNCRILGRGELGLLGVLVPFSSSDGATEITYTQELFHFSPNVPDRIGQSIIPLGSGSGLASSQKCSSGCFGKSFELRVLSNDG